MPISSTPLLENISKGEADFSLTSISTRRSSRSPSRSCRRSFSRVSWNAGSPPPRHRFPGGAEGGRRRSRSRSSVLNLRLFPDLFDFFLTDHIHRHPDQVADDGLDVPADIAHLGEFAGFDLEERRGRELGQPARDLGLSDARRSDHEDVFRGDLIGQFGGNPPPPITVAQGDRHGFFRRILPDDIFIELGDDLPRRQLGLLALGPLFADLPGFSADEWHSQLLDDDLARSCRRRSRR